MNTYIRNIVVVLIANVVIFIIGWGCIVPDQLMDQTHLFGLIGNVEVVKGNTSTVFGICAVLSTLTLIVGLVEAIIEDYRPRFCQTTRQPEKPRKPLPTGTFAGNKMRIADPTAPEEVKAEDPVVPKMD